MVENDEMANTAARNARAFSVFLSELEYGATEKDLSNLKAKICEAMAEHALTFGGVPKAKLTLSLDFVLDSGMMSITPKIDHVLPVRPRQKTAYFLTRDNDLSRSDPRQAKLPFQQVGGTESKSAATA